MLALFLASATGQTTTTESGANTVIEYFTSETGDEASEGQTWLRMAHGKPHGCVQSTVSINANLPSNLQQGIFVPGASYPAFIRFSNGVGRGFTALLQANESDAVPDIRGLGLKIFSCSKVYSIKLTVAVAWRNTISRFPVYDKSSWFPT